ncbi:MAG: type II toxin-antitoxin system VapC family toxin [Solirubrobacterales bacterium]
MPFWDASAVVPLLMEEAWSRELSERVELDEELSVWWGTRVEAVSAIRRRERVGEVDADGARESLKLLDRLATAWVELQPSAAVRTTAERLLAVHPLRAADAFQLAAAMAWRRDPLRPAGFVCFDERLRDAAAREGFQLSPEAIG